MARIALASLFGVLFCSSAFSLHAGEPEVAPAPRRIYNQDEQVPSSFRGKVIVLTDDAITVKPEGHVASHSTRTLANGKKETWAYYLQDNTKPPMAFMFTADLKRFGFSERSRQHNRADVRTGDIVLVGCFRDKGVMYCGGIQIHRRPGGKVPPAMGDDKFPKEYQHLRMDAQRNREQLMEECFELASVLILSVSR